MQNKAHWEHIYHTKDCAQVSWYQLRPSLSLQHIKNTGVGKTAHIIDATFASDGPDHCSGLEVARYDPESLYNEFGTDFELLDSTHEEHQTPFGTEQKFIYCYCRKY